MMKALGQRNVLTHTPAQHKTAMTEGLKRIFRAETAQEARQKAYALIEEMENAAPKAVACLEEGLEDALAVMALPKKYRRRLKLTNGGKRNRLPSERRIRWSVLITETGAMSNLLKGIYSRFGA
ncbi:transposase [Sulfurivirga caldicuralii]|uniref:transposase n=1 Tax=Sulfurivirga caldicuralii TaxID=364032 RepID=UPI00190E8411|nr:transposase [Sulfurivirga caldicuralii]